jgi:hypothetical protein
MSATTVSGISKEYVIYDCDKKPYTVCSASSYQELKNLKGLYLDRRIAQQSDDWQSGVRPDLDHSRFQVFLLKDKAEVIGLTTLFVVPYKNFSKQGYLRLKNGVVSVTPLTEILETRNPNTLMLECGFTQLLPAYRSKKLGLAAISSVVVPTALELIKAFQGDVIVFSSAQGVGSEQLFRRIRNNWNQFLEGKCQREISIPMEDLGKVAPQAKFTEKAARSLGLKRLDDVYNFRLGPVFVKKL